MRKRTEATRVNVPSTNHPPGPGAGNTRHWSKPKKKNFPFRADGKSMETIDDEQMNLFPKPAISGYPASANLPPA